jgi:sugar (pentulose or hexulose) kinase
MRSANRGLPRFMGGREHAILTDGLEGSPTAEDAAAVLAKGILLLPSVQAGSGPFPHRTAEWRGAQDIPPGQKLAAIAFYLAMMTATCLDLIGADGDTIAEGPFARNDLYLRMLAAATGRGVVAGAARGVSTSIGAALLATQTPQAIQGRESIIAETDPRWTAYARLWRAAAAV